MQCVDKTMLALDRATNETGCYNIQSWII